MLIAGAPFAPAGQAAEAPQWLSFTAPKPIAAAAGHATFIDLRFRVRDGFHVNSSHPRSSLLIPTRLTLTLPEGLSLQGTGYPAGKTLVLSFDPKEPLDVYSGAFTIRAQVEPNPDARPGDYQVTGGLRYQACSDRACYPPKTLPVSFEVKVSAAR